jgi:hypothetical protein
MILLLILSVITGAIISGVTGIGVLFWAAGGFVFICGLPVAAVTSFIHGEVSYAQDRADYRQMMADMEAEELADERELAEEARFDRLIELSGARTSIYNDNRQVHLHGKEEF